MKYSHWSYTHTHDYMIYVNTKGYFGWVEKDDTVTCILNVIVLVKLCVSLLTDKKFELQCVIINKFFYV